MAAAQIDWELIVVDDNSPDETRDVCRDLAESYPVRLIVRTAERGLSSAVIAGMRAAHGDVLLCMDADLSHPPEAIPAMVAALQGREPVVAELVRVQPASEKAEVSRLQLPGNSQPRLHNEPADFVVGSRYVAGGQTEDDWGLFRWLNSRAATWLARPLTRLSDPMAGFFALRRTDFEAHADNLNPIGYKIGLELLIKCGCRRVVEIPIHFRNRLHGESKLSFREQLNYLRHLGRLYAFRFPTALQFARFGIVGLSGMAVDLTMLWLLLSAGMSLPLASVAAIWIAMSSNFLGNRAWTFAGCRRDSWFRQYAVFCGSCLCGALLNWTTRVLLWRYVPFFTEHALAAAAVGVAAGTLSNFTLCRLIVFRRRTSPVPADVGIESAPHRTKAASGSRIPDPTPIPSTVRAEPSRAERRASPLAQRVLALVLGGWLAATGLAAAPETGVATAPQARTELDVSEDAVEQRLSAAAAYLASDELEGRGIRTQGLDLAAEYLAREFAAAGLRTDHYGGTPFHEFKLFSGATKGSVQELSFSAPDQNLALKPGDDFTSLTLSVISPIALPVVFAGYGITAPELGYDDYAGLNVAGKAVIVLRHEPQASNPESVFNGVENSDYAFVRPKIDNAVKHGAAMLILCTDAAALAPADGASEPPVDELLRVELEESSLRESIPVVHCRRDVIESLLSSAGGESLAEIESQIDATLQPRSRELPRTHLTGRVGLSREGRVLKNVVASLEGVGPLAEETLVIGAHYDHLGRGGWGSLAIGANHEIHNGADDNASGTAVLIELAHQLAARDEPLRRRILFIAFSAEELGLIGSAKYVQDPLVPLSSTIAMLNLDMVGRLRDGKLTMYGTGTAAEWTSLVDQANAPLGLDIKRVPGGYGPSDHASFFERGIPVLHLFTGFHNQYHRPSDDAELLNIDGMRQITELVREIAVDLAQADQRPTSTGSQSQFDLGELADLDADFNVPRPADRPLLGVQLQPHADGGVVVQRLVRNAAAEQHGIRPGDILLSVDDKPADSTEAVIQALRDHPREETLKVRLKRRGVEMEFDITF